MIYPLLRAMAGIALRWYYRAIEISGTERIPRQGAIILVVNHPNALVDALLVGWAVPRRILLTAKATLFTNPLADRLLRWIGVVPLRRTIDESGSGSGSDPSRNLASFRAVVETLRKGAAVLVFPEGVSRDEPALQPLRTGAARMALQGYGGRDGAAELTIVPIGLIFERKEAPRSRVFVQVGEPLPMSAWRCPAGVRPADALTEEITARLRAVTLNYASLDDAAQGSALAATFATVLEDDAPPLREAARGLSREAAIARRLEELRARLSTADAATRRRAAALVAGVEALREELRSRRIRLTDISISLARRDAARFALRETWILIVGAPVALWGEVNHYLPFLAAGAIARRSVHSAADPAMRTIVAGLVLVLIGYAVQGTIVGLLAGPWWALLYLATLPIAADVNFSLRDRVRRAGDRARAYLVFRRDPALHARLRETLLRLRGEALALEAALDVREPVGREG